MAKGSKTVKRNVKPKKDFGGKAEYGRGFSAKQKKKMFEFEKKQEYKMQQLRGQQNKQLIEAQTALEKAKKGGASSVIKSSGEAAGRVATPVATNLTVQKTSADVTGMKGWASLMGGNPDSEKGSDGNSQGRSTTETTSGGDFGGSAFGG